MNIESLSAAVASLSDADRKALLAKVSATRDPAHVAALRESFRGLVDPANHDVLLNRLDAAGAIRHSMPDVSASAENLRKARVDRLNAAKENPATRSSVTVLEGLLRRGGVSLDDVADADLKKIDAVFAKSTLSMSDRIAAKAILHRFGVL